MSLAAQHAWQHYSIARYGQKTAYGHSKALDHTGPEAVLIVSAGPGLMTSGIAGMGSDLRIAKVDSPETLCLDRRSSMSHLYLGGGMPTRNSYLVVCAWLACWTRDVGIGLCGCWLWTDGIVLDSGDVLG